ncbi:tetratricopeptide repeat-containing sulfotransferase family protein [Alteromonas ponticola]|uniref:Tetratricopeptide repeat protein n=1 Tax=Alteromonas ponticola TaxID=2720613 RepID=A0ABX1R2V3_9ALTE|nr:sulfotransferase [Alteromonas ponticola]NMH60098.1 tetratricopeptide repeat protein [Alteromonas ponticola]
METRSQLISKAEAACDAGDVVNAQRACSIYQKNFGEDPDILCLTGRTLLNLRQYTEAEKALTRSYEQSQSNITLAYLIIAACASYNRARVETVVTELQFDQIEQYELLVLLGQSLATLKLHTLALDAYNQVCAIWPRRADGFYYAGRTYVKLGNRPQAVVSLKQAIDIEPTHLLANHTLAIANPADFDSAQVAALSDAFKQAHSAGDQDSAVILAHTLNKIYAHQGAYRKAENILLQAKGEFVEDAEISEARNAAIFDWLLEGKRENCFGSVGSASDQPIFIVGMPETGSNIVAHILSAHPEVATPSSTNLFVQAVSQLCDRKKHISLDLKALLEAEELDNQRFGEYYLQLTNGMKSGSEKYTVDYQPYNFFNVSLIKRALPNAKVIIMLRDPVETVIANYLKLTLPFNHTNGYTYDLTYCCRYYRHFYNLMHRWQSIYGDSIRIQSYAALSSDWETEVNALFDYCGFAAVDKSTRAFQQRILSAHQKLTNNNDLDHYTTFAELVRNKLSDLLSD